MNTPEVISNELVFPHIEKYGVVHPYPAHVQKFPEDVLRRIVFSITKPAPKVDIINPGLRNIARLLNIYEYEHISYKRYEISAVIYGEAIPAVLNNNFYKKLFYIDNPNIELISSLKQSKVRLYACWQSMQDNDYDEDMIIEGIEITSCAMNTLLYFQQNHYNMIPL